jgi:hypothetical protein
VAHNIAHLHVAIELDSDPIKGHVAAGGAEGRRFNGWIELVEAIEDARVGAPGSTAGQTLGLRPGANGALDA